MARTKEIDAVQALADARATEQAAHRAVSAKQTQVWAAERAVQGGDLPARWAAERDLPQLRVDLADLQIAAASARQARIDVEPRVREKRTAYYKPLVLAAVQRFDDALETARVAHAELSRLGTLARADHATAAFENGLPWPEFGDPDFPKRGSRLETWRAWARRYGWL